MDTVFLACAALGGGAFLVRTLMQLIGAGADHGDAAGVHHADGDAGFRVLSFQGLAAFLMMFGLVGLALVRQSGVAAALALILAALAGVATVWVIARLFAFMGRLQSSGTINMWSAVGQEGSVYLTLPRGGLGKVEVVVQGRLGVFDARAEDGAELPTGSRISVVSVESGDVLVVQAIQPNVLPNDKREGAT